MITLRAVILIISLLALNRRTLMTVNAKVAVIVLIVLVIALLLVLNASQAVVQLTIATSVVLMADSSPANAGFVSQCSLYSLIHMYHIQYWNEGSFEWKGTGSGTFYDKSQAIARMRGMAAQCDYCVRFRVTEAAYV